MSVYKLVIKKKLLKTQVKKTASRHLSTRLDKRVQLRTVKYIFLLLYLWVGYRLNIYANRVNIHSYNIVDIYFYVIEKLYHQIEDRHRKVDTAGRGGYMFFFKGQNSYARIR